MAAANKHDPASVSAKSGRSFVARHGLKRGKWLVLWLLLLGPPAFAGTKPDNEALASALDAVVAPYVSRRDFMGVIGVKRDDEPPELRAYGRASVELDVPHEPDNVFAIGSISKQMTAVAILRLAEREQLDINDPLTRFLPDFHPSQAITIEQLLIHTAGVADIYSLPVASIQATDLNLDSVVEALSRLPLTQTPGSGFAYSNGGYAVLARIVEIASGQDFGQFLQDELFQPLGLTRTWHDSRGAARAGQVAGYDPYDAAGLTPASLPPAALLTGSGSIWSSADDLLTWAEALHTGKLLEAANYARMVTSQDQGYGYGVSVFRRFGRPVVGHDGRTSGFSSDLARYVDERITIVVLGNVQSVARDEIRRLVAAVVFAEPHDPPAPRTLLPAGAVPVAGLAGRYVFGPWLEVEISVRGERLLARANQGGWSELVPMANGRWFSRSLYVSVGFERNKAGEAVRLVWGEGRNAPAGERVPPPS